MSVSENIQNESDLAKTYIANSKLDENYKKTLIQLINTTTIATNGISPEQKIQKMTEAVHLLAVSQGMYFSSIDKMIE